MKATIKPEFRGYDAYAAMTIYRRNLPHWRQAGATYFVTFRLGDSVPKAVVRQWQDEDNIWLKANKVDGQLSEELQAEYSRRIARRLHVELDKCHGCCLFRREDTREVLSQALHHFHGTRWWVGDFVIMPNHVHGLFQPIAEAVERCSAPFENGMVGNGPEDRSTFKLEDILGSVKGFVSTRLTKLNIKPGKVWQQENYDRLVRDRVELAAWRNYIECNPAKAKLRDGEFEYYRCSWLNGDGI